MMKMRTELKYVISYTDYIRLKPFLDAYLKIDEHAHDGHYIIRSLYFDTLENDDLHDNLMGYEKKKKIRLRHYEGTSKYVIEVKHKIGSKGYKEGISLSREEAIRIANGEYSLLMNKGKKGLTLYTEMQFNTYRPKTVIVYKRYPYVFGANNTRVTFDYHIKSTDICSSFFDIEITSLSPITELQQGVFEIKYDDYIFGPLQEIMKELKIHPVANSKYTLARLGEY